MASAIKWKNEYMEEIDFVLSFDFFFLISQLFDEKR